MGFKSTISIEEIRRRLRYDPLSGELFWRIDVAKNVKAGSRAGGLKGTGNGNSHVYIKVGHDIPAARVAWAIHYGEWPEAKLSFVDGDTQNLRISNLKMMNSLITKYDHSDPDQRKSYLKEHRATFPKAWKNTHLMAKFGVSLDRYNEMLEAQNHRCAICGEAETATRHGKVKMLAVDHDHATGAIRDLLCSDCNTGIGKLKDRAEILDKAAAYIRRHSA